MRGVILYGPPAAGKDTITAALCELDSQFKLYERLKVGRGRTAGYCLGTQEDADQLRASGDIIWENTRYGSRYLVDRSSLMRQLRAGHTPIVHLGQVEAIDAVRRATPQVQWLTVYLWCPRDVALVRLQGRGSADIAERLDAWDATEPLARTDLAINTADKQPVEAATAICKTLDGLVA